VKRTAWLVAIVVVVVIAIGAFAWQRHRAATPAAPVTATPTMPRIRVLPPAPDQQTADHEQQEMADANTIAGDLRLADKDRAALLAALADLQLGRRALFADLAAKKITTEQVSSGLHDLRTKLRSDLVRDLGPDRAKQILDRMREDHR